MSVRLLFRWTSGPVKRPVVAGQRGARGDGGPANGRVHIRRPDANPQLALRHQDAPGAGAKGAHRPASRPSGTRLHSLLVKLISNRKMMSHAEFECVCVFECMGVGTEFTTHQ